MTLPDAARSARGERLRAFCGQLDGVPFQWGVDDCTAWAIKWFEAETGLSLNLPSYSSEKEARAMVADAGGLVGLWSRELASNGVHEAYPPRLGDVGILQFSTGAMGCIFAEGGLVMVRSEAGVRCIRPRDVLASWQVPECA